MKKNTFLIFLSITLMLIAFSSCKKKPPADQLVIQYATANPKGSAHVLHAEKLKELLEKYSDNKMTMELHVGGVKGSEQDNAMDVSTGKLDMACMAVNNITSFTPIVGFMTLPYMFTDISKARKLLLTDNDILKKINKGMIEKGKFRALGWLDSGYRVLANGVREVKSPADLKGLKLRVPENSIMVAFYRANGLEPIPVSWTKTYESFMNGTINGHDNPYLSFMNMPKAKKPFWKFQKYITDLHYILLILVNIVNEDFYQKLTPDQRAILDKASKEANEFEWKWSQKENKRLLDLLLKNGMKLTKPANNEKEWIKNGRSVWPKFYDKIGGRQLVDEVVKYIE